jgi:micrococcal nuclease
VSDRFCPSCGERRIGESRFCRGCGIDLDALTAVVEPMADVPTPVTPRRPYGRYVVIGVMALLALGAIGSLSKGAAATLTPAPTIAQRATATPPTPITTLSTPPAPASTAPASPLAFGPTGSTSQGTVTRVIDGDTVVVEVAGTEYHVRYIGMDTPESVKPNTPVQAMAKEASAANSALVEGQPVILERDVSETDRYDRLLRDVWVERDGALVLVGLELVRTGYAQVTTFPPDVRYVALLLAAQETARSSELGLWRGAPASTTAPTAAPKSLVGGAGPTCHPSYSPCLPVVSDLDCPDVRAMGKAPVTVKGPDDYRLDRDGDGTGCD